MITKSASKCPAGISYFCTINSLKTPQTAAGLGRRKISQLRTPGGVQASCAYQRTPVGRVQGCCQVCVCACVAVLYNALRSSSGMSFFIPGLNRPVCMAKNTIIDNFLRSQKPPWSHRRVNISYMPGLIRRSIIQQYRGTPHQVSTTFSNRIKRSQLSSAHL